jgi:hypothetical protein
MSDTVAAFLARAADQPVRLTVHNLLAIWGASYRDYDAVGRIQRDLAAASLHCHPPFTEGSVNSVVQVGTQSGEAAEQPVTESATAEDEELVLPEVSLRISDIPSAVGGVTAVSPDAVLA